MPERAGYAETRIFKAAGAVVDFRDPGVKPTAVANQVKEPIAAEPRPPATRADLVRCIWPRHDACTDALLVRHHVNCLRDRPDRRRRTTPACPDESPVDSPPALCTTDYRTGAAVCVKGGAGVIGRRRGDRRRHRRLQRSPASPTAWARPLQFTDINIDKLRQLDAEFARPDPHSLLIGLRARVPSTCRPGD